MKVALIGSCSPPFGGIEVHIKRLADMLEKSGMHLAIYDVENISESDDVRVNKIARAKLWALWYFFTINEDVIHVHTLSWKHRAAMTLIARMRQKKIIITFHSLRDEIENMSQSEKALVRYVLKNADVLIAVSDKVAEKLEAWGCKKDRIRRITGFLPPGLEETELPENLLDFIDNHKLIISANGSNMNFYKGDDLYGLDMLVELCARISNKYDLGFLYCISRGYINNQEYYEHIKGVIREKGIEDRFMFVHENLEFSSILKRSDVFIRPTNTDGYAISVAEALYAGIPSISSDAAKRPPGTIIFKTRDIEDLCKRTVDVIENIEMHKKKLEYVEKEDNGERLLKVYRDLFAEEG